MLWLLVHFLFLQINSCEWSAYWLTLVITQFYSIFHQKLSFYNGKKLQQIEFFISEVEIYKGECHLTRFKYSLQLGINSMSLSKVVYGTTEMNMLNLIFFEFVLNDF